uniref:Uncharacterized protein n=1 Tax=Monodelphis domestica TaxID=13616 RepID=A0A5F8GRT7_MONDO
MVETSFPSRLKKSLKASWHIYKMVSSLSKHLKHFECQGNVSGLHYHQISLEKYPLCLGQCVCTLKNNQGFCPTVSLKMYPLKNENKVYVNVTKNKTNSANSQPRVYVSFYLIHY